MTTATSLHPSSSHPRPKTLGELRRVPDFDAGSLQHSVKDELRANLLRAIERNEPLFGPRLGLKNFKAHTTFRRSYPTRLQSHSMAGRHCPETAVLNRRVFQRKPEAHDVYRVIV